MFLRTHQIFFKKFIWFVLLANKNFMNELWSSQEQPIWCAIILYSLKTNSFMRLEYKPILNNATFTLTEKNQTKMILRFSQKFPLFIEGGWFIKKY